MVSWKELKVARPEVLLKLVVRLKFDKFSISNSVVLLQKLVSL